MIFTFSMLTAAHFPLLFKWLETPHVKAWWDQDVQWTLPLIEEKFGDYTKGYKLEKGQKKTICAFIICLDDEPIGYIQLYNVHDFPRDDGVSIDSLPSSCAAFDWYIGEYQYTGKGIGTRILNQFVQEHIFPKFDHIFVDPDTANRAAIRSYEKAGFVTTALANDGSISLMLRSKHPKDILYTLESMLIAPLYPTPSEIVHELIAEDFVEIGSTGQIYAKDDILSYHNDAPTPIKIKDFQAKDLTDDLYLTGYKTIEDPISSIRTSIWKQTKGKWQLIFHQSTLICP